MSINVRPYMGGGEPYIFVSHASDDEDVLDPIFSRLDREGYHMWFYEGGTNGGNEWDLNVMKNIEECNLLLAYVSKDFLSSGNCLSEMYWAVKNNKKVVFIYPEHIDVSDLGESQKNFYNRLDFHFPYVQVINWFECSEDEFYKKLIDAIGMEECKASEKAGDSPENSVKAERVIGIWNGKEVNFNRVWSGHKFTDEEVEALLNGDEIEVYDAMNSNGIPYACKVHLEEYEFNGGIARGLKISGPLSLYSDGEWSGENIQFKVVWGGHKFTEEECEKLLAGDEISFDYVSKNGKTIQVEGKLEKQEYMGYKYVGFNPNW